MSTVSFTSRSRGQSRPNEVFLHVILKMTSSAPRCKLINNQVPFKSNHLGRPVFFWHCSKGQSGPPQVLRWWSLRLGEFPLALVSQPRRRDAVLRHLCLALRYINTLQTMPTTTASWFHPADACGPITSALTLKANAKNEPQQHNACSSRPHTTCVHCFDL